ncbi:hypothetical protein CPAR01_14318 [Colletotrichum paranaense]|uniref:Uncharacterized protein n=1 Tax=Colletotrichum paranaense TaxID=1914294 RepID=A0ABQ9S1U8_9PEZI|nr:uncharacterized protein CPAR01_14318 [Colletotrichum paranaense]KAK1522775.1 hypothetical protein CPAR01_14318 [Colletotrichum paranaense]
MGWIGSGTVHPVSAEPISTFGANSRQDQRYRVHAGEFGKLAGIPLSPLAVQVIERRMRVCESRETPRLSPSCTPRQQNEDPVTSVGLGVRTSVSVIIPCNMSHELGISLLPGDVQKESVRRENSHLMILRPTTKASSSSSILSHREWQVPGDEKSTTGVRRRR